jgi:hypothetical protein
MIDEMLPYIHQNYTPCVIDHTTIRSFEEHQSLNHLPCFDKSYGEGGRKERERGRERGRGREKEENDGVSANLHAQV